MKTTHIIFGVWLTITAVEGRAQFLVSDPGVETATGEMAVATSQTAVSAADMASTMSTTMAPALNATQAATQQSAVDTAKILANQEQEELEKAAKEADKNKKKLAAVAIFTALAGIAGIP